MTRVDLDKFNVAKLPRGSSRSFEVRNRTTKYGEWHYFHRTEDGKLFHNVESHGRDGKAIYKEWLAAADKDKDAFMLLHKPNNFEPVKACPCILCKPVDATHE